MSLPEDAQASPVKLFEGDGGELPLETRRALVQLLAGPSLDGQRHPKLWPVLVRDEALIRRRLSELFLDLVIDTDTQVAFTRRAQLTFLDSIMLLHLRQRLTQADAQGERAVISVDEIVEHMSVYERSTNTDRAGFHKRIQASIEKIKTHNILQKIRSSEDRYEISPTLKLLFSAEAIQSLTRTFQSMADGEAVTPAPLPETDDEAGL
jgi:hypothetical protein